MYWCYVHYNSLSIPYFLSVVDILDCLLVTGFTEFLPSICAGWLYMFLFGWGLCLESCHNVIVRFSRCYFVNVCWCAIMVSSCIYSKLSLISYVIKVVCFDWQLSL